jgi:predicted N-acetyltransferase YhbS
MNEFPHRRSFADDPALCDQVFDLLHTWLPALPRMRKRAERLRWRWEDVSTPFVHEQDGRVISHVGVLEMNLVCHGETRRVGGIHAVCTLEAERRRGLFRVLIEEALAHCEERYETVELSTENPEYYEPFGFRSVPEFRFLAEVGSPPGRNGFRRLRLDDAADLDRLEDLLRHRVPVSRTLSVASELDVFKFNEGSGDRLYLCEELELVAVISRADSETGPGQLVIDDLVAPELPELGEILARWPEPVREVCFHFCPEHLDVVARPEAVQDDVFMVRGEFPYGDSEELPKGRLAPPARH